jgi:hypothetical protein
MNDFPGELTYFEHLRLYDRSRNLKRFQIAGSIGNIEINMIVMYQHLKMIMKPSLSFCRAIMFQKLKQSGTSWIVRLLLLCFTVSTFTFQISHARISDPADALQYIPGSAYTENTEHSHSHDHDLPSSDPLMRHSHGHSPVDHSHDVPAVCLKTVNQSSNTERPRFTLRNQQPDSALLTDIDRPPRS